MYSKIFFIHIGAYTYVQRNRKQLLQGEHHFLYKTGVRHGKWTELGRTIPD